MRDSGHLVPGVLPQLPQNDILATASAACLYSPSSRRNRDETAQAKGISRLSETGSDVAELPSQSTCRGRTAMSDRKTRT